MKAPIGRRVRRYRRRLGLTQEQLAARAGVHRITIAHLERGAGGVGLAVLVKLAMALRVPLDVLVAVPRDRRRRATR